MFQWLGLWALTAKGLGSIPDWGTKIPQATKYGQKKKKKSKTKLNQEHKRQFLKLKTN